jgi:glutathione synthase/RimK-type ligase-like ATP-grasp enzyme
MQAIGANATLLLLVGADRGDQINVSGNRARLAGSSDFHQLIEPNRSRHLLQVTPNILKQRRRPDLSPYSCLVNLVTEPERNEKVLEAMRKLLRGVHGKVINPPEAVLRSTRDQVARRLADVPGLLVPKIVRLRTTRPQIVRETIERAGLQFPAILREVATHTGMIVGRFDSVEELQQAMHDGVEHVATEFVDYRSDDGLYRKYRVFFIGPHVIFRHKLFSEHWNVHGKDRDRVMVGRPDLIEEEVALFATPDGAFPPEVKQVLTAVRERIDLDYFGMDFGIARDGRVLLFEANATMSFYSKLPGPEFDYLQACLPPARAAFRALIGSD